MKLVFPCSCLTSLATTRFNHLHTHTRSQSAPKLLFLCKIQALNKLFTMYKYIMALVHLFFYFVPDLDLW